MSRCDPCDLPIFLIRDLTPYMRDVENEHGLVKSNVNNQRPPKAVRCI